MKDIRIFSHSIPINLKANVDFLYASWDVWSKDVGSPGLKQCFKLLCSSECYHSVYYLVHMSNQFIKSFAEILRIFFMYAQIVCTRPFLICKGQRAKGKGDEASICIT